MVRNFKKKTKRGEISQQRFERAYADIKEGILSLREAARTYEIDKMTLFRYKKKKKQIQRFE
jgi:DNA invertase Pin-like site-specific DNA recombinase